MEFTLPTTQTEMYNTLKELFYYYRIRRGGYAGISLENISLERMQFTPLTDQQLISKAEVTLAAKHEKEITEYVEKLNIELEKIVAKMDAIPTQKAELIGKTTESYAESIRKIELTIAKNGLSESSILADKITALEQSKNLRISEIDEEYYNMLVELNSQRSALEILIGNASSHFEEIHRKEIIAKTQELKDEQIEAEREVFRYNNGLDEKEKRYANTVAQTNATLEIRFLEIRSAEYTKDELIEMGYYEDVIDCVCGYYDRSDAITAYKNIVNDKKLSIYLDDYYDSILYMYKSRAGV